MADPYSDFIERILSFPAAISIIFVTFFLSYFLVSSSRSTPLSSLEIELLAEMEHNRWQVNKVDAATYRYRSWNKPKTTDLKPDMDLKSKDISVSGSGVCRHYEYSFKTGKVEFLLDDNKTCVEGKPPANIIGNLSVLINDELKNHYYCFKQ